MSAPPAALPFVKMKINLKPQKGDILLCCCLLAIAAVSFIMLKLSAERGGVAVVTVDGQVVGEYTLSKDASIRIGDDQNGNTLVIQDGCAHIKDATCPDKLCEKQGRICYNKQTLVCLPNKTVITVTGTAESKTDFIQ